MIVAAAAALAALPLGACTSTGGTAPLSVASVEQALANGCGYYADGKVIADIIAGGNPALATTEAIANSICAVVKPAAGLKRGAALPTVDGVTIRGHFIR
jgi:hypothetical protein